MPVDVCGQPVYAVTKKFNRDSLTKLVLVHTFFLFGGLHSEISSEITINPELIKEISYNKNFIEKHLFDYRNWCSCYSKPYKTSWILPPRVLFLNMTKA